MCLSQLCERVSTEKEMIYISPTALAPWCGVLPAVWDREAGDVLNPQLHAVTRMGQYRGGAGHV